VDQKVRAPERILAGLAAAVAILAGTGGIAGTVAHADSSFDSALLSLLNQDRASHGLPALQSSGPLGGLAESSSYSGCGYTIAGRAEDMIQRNYFSHTLLNCGSQNVFSIMRADGIPFGSAAENLGYASGISDPTSAAQWINTHFMDSSEHEANILNSAFTTVGIGSWRTAAGQNWSGAGSSMSNVIVAAVEFTDGPRPAATAPAPRHVTAARAVLASVAAAAPPARPAAHLPGPAMPATGALGLAPLDDDDLAPVRWHSDAVYEVASWRVSDEPGSSSGTTPVSVAATGAALVLALLEWVRRMLARRRRRAVPVG
jgi:uncharacterized protein YkwD